MGRRHALLAPTVVCLDARDAVKDIGGSVLTAIKGDK